MKLSLLLFSFSFIFIIAFFGVSSKRFIVKTKHGGKFQSETRKQTKGIYRHYYKNNKHIPSNPKPYIILYFFQSKWNDWIIQEEDQEMSHWKVWGKNCQNYERKQRKMVHQSGRKQETGVGFQPHQIQNTLNQMQNRMICILTMTPSQYLHVM